MVEPRSPVVEDADDALEDEAANAERLGRVRLPDGLTRAWPVPRTAVLGARDGIAARIEAGLVDVVMNGLSVAPDGVRRPVLGALARLARRFDRRHSDAARDYLRQAFGAATPDAEIEARVLQAWKHLLDVTVASESFHRHVPFASIRDHFDVKMTDDVRAILERKVGCIVVAAHVGDWEAGSAVMPWLGFDPFYVISKPPRNRPLSIHAQRLREARGVRLIPRRGAMQYAATIVKSGGTLAMMLDQRARKRPVLAPLFGRLARCDRSVGVLLRRLACPVVFSACYRTERAFHYELTFPTVLWPEDLAGQTPEAIARKINAEIEAMIRAHPEQYLWLHDRYRGAPPP